MTDPKEASNEECLKLADQAEALPTPQWHWIRRAQTAIRSLVARLEAAEKNADAIQKAADYTLRQNLAIAESGRQRAEAALAEAAETEAAHNDLLLALWKLAVVEDVGWHEGDQYQQWACVLCGQFARKKENIAHATTCALSAPSPTRVAELVAAAREVYRLSERRTGEWDRLKQALAAFTPPAQEQSDD